MGESLPAGGASFMITILFFVANFKRNGPVSEEQK